MSKSHVYCQRYKSTSAARPLPATPLSLLFPPGDDRQLVATAEKCPRRRAFATLHWKKQKQHFESTTAMPGHDNETGKREEGRVHHGRYCRGSEREKPLQEVPSLQLIQNLTLCRLHVEGAFSPHSENLVSTAPAGRR